MPYVEPEKEIEVGTVKQTDKMSSDIADIVNKSRGGKKPKMMKGMTLKGAGAKNMSNQLRNKAQVEYEQEAMK